MILVTGGTGLVGAHLLLHLIESRAVGDQKVRAIYRNPKNIEKTKLVFERERQTELFKNIEWIQADITDIPALEKAFDAIDYVYHCAAIISFDPRDEAIIRKTNIEGTANIVNFCISKGVKKLCFISSTAALGDLAPNQTVITEETEWNPEKPHSDYAISKYGAEMEVWRGQQEGLEVIIVNPGVILGIGFLTQGSGKLIKKAAKGLNFYTLGGTGFIAVVDVVRIIVYLMDSAIHNERFTLITENINYRTLINTIADGVKIKRPKYHAFPLLMEVVWRVDWIFSLIFNKKRQLTKNIAKASYATTEFSNEKITKTIPFSLTPIDQFLKKITAYL